MRTSLGAAGLAHARCRMSKPKLGVVLFQLGGPDSREAVEPFLYNLFCDPDIINFPGPGWRAVRWRAISPAAARKWFASITTPSAGSRRSAC